MGRHYAKVPCENQGTAQEHEFLSPRMNKKVEQLNRFIGSMLGKMLLNKPMKLWDLYINQAVFSYGVRTYTTMKTSLFYLLYGQQPHLLGDQNIVLTIDSETASYEDQLKLFQSARKEAAIAWLQLMSKHSKTRMHKMIQ
jgi:hypothetical protein